jgi:hypothetical protein
MGFVEPTAIVAEAWRIGRQTGYQPSKPIYIVDIL